MIVLESTMTTSDPIGFLSAPISIQTQSTKASYMMSSGFECAME
jgi:hypothetical protein